MTLLTMTGIFGEAMNQLVKQQYALDFMTEDIRPLSQAVQA